MFSNFALKDSVFCRKLFHFSTCTLRKWIVPGQNPIACKHNQPWMRKSLSPFKSLLSDGKTRLSKRMQGGQSSYMLISSNKLLAWSTIAHRKLLTYLTFVKIANGNPKISTSSCSHSWTCRGWKTSCKTRTL